MGWQLMACDILAGPFVQSWRRGHWLRDHLLVCCSPSTGACPHHLPMAEHGSNKGYARFYLSQTVSIEETMAELATSPMSNVSWRTKTVDRHYSFSLPSFDWVGRGEHKFRFEAGITDYDGPVATKKHRREGIVFFYVKATSNSLPFPDLQPECDQISVHVRDHVLAHFVMDSPSLQVVRNLRKLRKDEDSPATITFAKARENMGLRAVQPTPTVPSTSSWSRAPPSGLVTDRGTSQGLAPLGTDPGASQALPSSSGHRPRDQPGPPESPELAEAPEPAPTESSSSEPGSPAWPWPRDSHQPPSSPSVDWGGDQSPVTVEITIEDEAAPALQEREPGHPVPAAAPTQEDQDRELQRLSPTPHMVEQATAYLMAQSTGAVVTATDHGAGDGVPPLCAAVASCSVSATPCTSPRSSRPEEEVPKEVVLMSGVRKLEDHTVVLEPMWYHARSITWLLGVRQRVQDDTSFLDRGRRFISVG